MAETGCHHRQGEQLPCDRFTEPGAVHQEGKAVEWRGTVEIVGARAQFAAPSGAAMEAP